MGRKSLFNHPELIHTAEYIGKYWIYAPAEHKWMELNSKTVTWLSKGDDKRKLFNLPENILKECQCIDAIIRKLQNENRVTYGSEKNLPFVVSLADGLLDLNKFQEWCCAEKPEVLQGADCAGYIENRIREMLNYSFADPDRPDREQKARDMLGYKAYYELKQEENPPFFLWSFEFGIGDLLNGLRWSLGIVSDDKPALNVKEFLKEYAPPDVPEKQENLFVRLIAAAGGYGIIPRASQKAIVLYGEGRNGKSTFRNAVVSVYPEGATANVPLCMFSSKYKFENASLAGCALNWPDEGGDSPDEKLFNLNEFKNFIHGEPYCCERKGKDPVYYRNTGQCVFPMNNVPDIPDRSQGMDDRFIWIPFKNEFSGGGIRYELKDREFRKRLLAFMFLQAWIAYMRPILCADTGDRERFNPLPECCMKLEREVRSQKWPLLDFVLDRIGNNQPLWDISTDVLYTDFKNYEVRTLQRIRLLDGRTIETKQAFSRDYNGLLSQFGRDYGVKFQSVQVRIGKNRERWCRPVKNPKRAPEVIGLITGERGPSEVPGGIDSQHMRLVG